MNNHKDSTDDYSGFLMRRKYYILFPFVLIFVSTILLAIFLPPTYKSTALILVEGEKASPDDYQIAPPTIVEATIENITQQLMRRENLINLIQTYNLYDNLKEPSGKKWGSNLFKTLHENDNARNYQVPSKHTEVPEWVIGKIKNNIKVELVTTNVINPRSGLPAMITTGFNISFEGNAPEKVYNIAQAISSFYLAHNTPEGANSRTLAEEENKILENHLSNLEARMENFKTKNLDYLPEMIPMYRQFIQHLEAESFRIDQEINRANQKIVFLKETQKAVDPRAKELEKMKMELASKEAFLSPKHPDIISLKKAIKSLEEDLMGQGEKPTVSETANLQSQITDVEKEIKDLEKRKVETKAKTKEYLRMIESAPKAEKEYQALVREYESTKIRYRETLNRLSETQKLEGQSNLSFNLIDPPEYPQKPYKPNRLMIILIGFTLALGTGFGTGFFKELSDNTIQSEKILSTLSNKPVLAVIPFIKKKDSKKETKKARGCDHE